MGQQQLLLVVLVTIVVGIATVAAIDTFSSASDTANIDAVRQDLLAMGAAAQMYYIKPEALGGGGRDFEGITLRDMSFAGNSTSDTDANNQNGTYQLNGGSVPGDVQQFDITGNPLTAGGSVTITVFADSTAMSSYTAP
jgi:type II secretory pathway pseudopilin PulG